VDAGGLVRALAAGEVIITATTGGTSGSAEVTLALRRAVTVQTSGGEVKVGGAGGVMIPAGTFTSPQMVTVEVTRAAEVEVDYSVTSKPYGAGPRMPNELRVRIGTTAPLESMALEMEVSPAFSAALPTSHRPELFVELLQSEGDEILDDFVPVSATYDATTRRLHAVLPSEAFTHWRRTDENLEAIVVVGSVPVDPPSNLLRSPSLTPAAVNGLDRRWMHAEASPCPRSALAAPLDHLEVTRGGKYNFPKHKGVDLSADTLTPVYASRSGVVEEIGFDERPLPKPDPRSGKKIKGWGRYVRLRHADGTRTVYAHLTAASTNHLAKDRFLEAGEQIALSGNTGGSSAPHLHVEYTLSKNPKTQFDPTPCLAAAIEVDPGSKSMEIGQTAPFAVRVITLTGSRVTGQTEAAWSSSNPPAASVDASGVVSAKSVGTARIRAALGRLEANASVTVTLPSPVFHSQLASFQSAAKVLGTLAFDGIQNGVLSTTPGGYPGVDYYSRASYGIVTIHALGANSNVPGFTSISKWTVHKTTYDFYSSGAHYGDALIPGLSAHGNGVLFTFADSPTEPITAVGAHFGSVQEVSVCCVQQWVIVRFQDNESLIVSLNEIRGGERPSSAFFGITSRGRPIKSIEFNQAGHNPLLDNFTYGQAH
jgi:hypothetical protein